MATITLDPDTHDRLRLVAATLEVDEPTAVRELLRRLASGVRGSEKPSANGSEALVPVFVVYKGTRIEGQFDPGTETLTITSGQLTGTTYNSPSRAAIEVVRLINPKVHPNRNGWGFWTVAATGRELQSIRCR